MKWAAVSIVACLFVMQIIPSMADDKEKGRSVVRKDLFHADLSDGSFVSIRAFVESLDKAQDTQMVELVRHKKGATNDHYPTHWHSDYLTAVQYTPKKNQPYALIREDDDRVFVFTLWNNLYFVVDKTTGHVAKKGNGDDVLRQFKDVVPLKVRFVPPQSGTARVASPEEIEEIEKRENEEAERALKRGRR